MGSLDKNEYLTGFKLFHGTTEECAMRIEKTGFRSGLDSVWRVSSRPELVYFSTAYAPYYAMAHGDPTIALVEVRIDPDFLYPDDDYIMYALGRPLYEQADIDALDIEKYRHLWTESLRVYGSVAARPEHVMVVGWRAIDATELLHLSDPCISPMNYRIMGAYYRKLSVDLYRGKTVKELINEQAVGRNVYGISGLV